MSPDRSSAYDPDPSYEEHMDRIGATAKDHQLVERAEEAYQEWVEWRLGKEPGDTSSYDSVDGRTPESVISEAYPDRADDRRVCQLLTGWLLYHEELHAEPGGWCERLSEDRVEEVRAYLGTGCTHWSVSQLTGVSTSIIAQISRGTYEAAS